MPELKIEKNEIYAVLIVFLVSLGFWHFPMKETLPDFNTAMVIQRLPEMSAIQPLHLQAAAALQGAYASLAGQEASSPQAIVSFLLIFPSVLLALTALFLYLALRQLGAGRSASAFAVILFACSLSAMQFLPGVFGSLPFAALPFSLFLLSFSHFHSKRQTIALVIAVFFAFLSAFLDAVFGIAGFLFLLSFALPSREKGQKALAQLIALGATFAAGAFLSHNAQSISLGLQGMQSLFSLSPFLLAASSCAAVLCFFREVRQEYLFLFLSGVLASAVSPFAGSMLLLAPAADGIRQAASDKLASRQAKLACAYSLAFFAIFGLASPLAGELKAVAISFMLSFLSPLLLHFYGYRNGPAFAAGGLALLVLSSSIALFYQLPPSKEFYPQYVDKDMAGALSSLTGKGVPKVALIGYQDAAKFYLRSSSLESQKALSQYLASGKGVPDSGTHLLISLSYFDEQAAPGGGYESYFPYSNLTSSGRNFAQFVSPLSGSVLVRELDTKGDFLLRDGQLIDQAGRVYASVPLSRMLLLRQDIPHDSAQNRLIVVEEGEPVPYFVEIYSGKADELAKVSEHGKVTVFKVN